MRQKTIGNGWRRLVEGCLGWVKHAVIIPLALCSASSFAQDWVLVKAISWPTFLADHGLQNPHTTTSGYNGQLTITQYSFFASYSWAPPNSWGQGCQTSFGQPWQGAAWCDPQTLRATGVSLETSVTRIPDVNVFSGKRLKVKWAVYSDAPINDPLIVVPIAWQWWYAHNYRIFSCAPETVDVSAWKWIECVIDMPTTQGLSGPPGESYTGVGLDFAAPFNGTFNVAITEVYIWQ